VQNQIEGGSKTAMKMIDPNFTPLQYRRSSEPLQLSSQIPVENSNSNSNIKNVQQDALLSNVIHGGVSVIPQQAKVMTSAQALPLHYKNNDISTVNQGTGNFNNNSSSTSSSNAPIPLVNSSLYSTAFNPNANAYSSTSSGNSYWIIHF
jgi:hypothetical protein